MANCQACTGETVLEPRNMTSTALLLLVVFVTAVAGQCFFRSFTQTVLHSKASDSCESPSISSVSGNLSQCTAQCVSLSQRCTMLEADGETQECNFYSACTDVMVWNADTRISVRNSCTSDCPEVLVTSKEKMIGTCIVILREYNMPDKNKCLSLCLDTAACRGASYRYRGGTCFLHDCGYNEYLFDGGRVFMQLNCTGIRTKSITESVKPPIAPTEIISTTIILPSMKLVPTSLVTATTALSEIISTTIALPSKKLVPMSLVTPTTTPAEITSTTMTLSSTKLVPISLVTPKTALDESLLTTMTLPSTKFVPVPLITARPVLTDTNWTNIILPSTKLVPTSLVTPTTALSEIISTTTTSTSTKLGSVSIATPTTTLAEINSTTLTFLSTKLVHLSMVTSQSPATDFTTKQSTTITLAPEDTHVVGFFEKLSNIVVLSSVGGILVTASQCTCIYLLGPKIGRRNCTVRANRIEDEISDSS